MATDLWQAGAAHFCLALLVLVNHANSPSPHTNTNLSHYENVSNVHF